MPKGLGLIIILGLALGGCGPYRRLADAMNVQVTPMPSPSVTPPQAQALGTGSQDWRVLWNGGGSVAFDQPGILLSPLPPENDSASHSALILSQSTIDQPLKDFRLRVRVTTESQLRAPTPNPWEVFWLFFNYTVGTDGMKRTNYFVLKTNGVELGRAYGTTDQYFLSTAPAPAAVVGTESRIEVLKSGQHVQVYVDGALAVDYQGTGYPQSIYDVPGAIGLYSEDARVRVSSVEIE